MGGPGDARCCPLSPTTLAVSGGHLSACDTWGPGPGGVGHPLRHSCWWQRPDSAASLRGHLAVCTDLVAFLCGSRLLRWGSCLKAGVAEGVAGRRLLHAAGDGAVFPRSLRAEGRRSLGSLTAGGCEVTAVQPPPLRPSRPDGWTWRIWKPPGQGQACTRPAGRLWPFSEGSQSSHPSAYVCWISPPVPGTRQVLERRVPRAGEARASEPTGGPQQTWWMGGWEALWRQGTSDYRERPL